jgi:hypothetical protein
MGTFRRLATAPCREKEEKGTGKKGTGTFRRAFLNRNCTCPLSPSVTGTLDDGPGNMNNVNQNENPVAKQLKQPERTTY